MATLSEVTAVVADRAELYRVLASLYFNPLTEAQIEAFSSHTALLAGKDVEKTTQESAELAAVLELESSAGEDDIDLVAEGFNDMRRYLRRRHTGTRQELAMDFTQCFLGARTYKGMTAAPYESLYRDPSGVLMGPIRHEVYSLYKSECVSLAEGVDYADDHLSFELEFLAILCDRCVEALEAGDQTEALRILTLQRDFLEAHPLQWINRFHNLSLKFLDTRFYRGVLKVTRGFLEGEPGTISDLCSEISESLLAA